MGITALAAGVRFSTLDRQSLWSDETITALLARMDLAHMLRTVSSTESTPPVYYVLVWAWAKVFGYGEFGLRSLSALAGTATVPVTWLAGSALTGRRVGLAAAALVAVSPPLVWYSQEARSYALVVLLCGVSFAAFARAIRVPTPRVLAVWAAASVLALGTHYFAVFVVGAEVLCLLVSRRSAGVVWASAVVAAGAAALAPLALEQRGNGLAEHVGTAGGSLVDRVVVLAKQFLVGASLPADRAVVGVVALLLVPSLVLLVSRTSASDCRAIGLAAGVGVAPIVVPVALAAVGLDYVNTRNALAGFVPLAIVGTAGLGLWRAHRVATLGLAALIGVSLAVTLVVAADPAYHRPDWRGFARAVGPPDVARAVVVSPDHEGWFARVPLQIYMPTARAIDQGLVPASPQFVRVARREGDHAAPPRVAVREVVVGGVGWELPVLPRPLPPEFTRVEEQVAAGYRFVRYRSSSPVLLATRRLVAPLSVVLLDRPRSR